ncbi:MAG: SMI1/KNR4 family protein [Planctomycetota bacterium]|jgi:hypothetical protein|nr:SMI1/KNR4 family protein [Planctomycetota bacterium]
MEQQPDELYRAYNETTIHALIEKLDKAGLKRTVPCSDEELDAAARALKVPFPPDYRHFMKEVGGPSKGKPWHGLFRIDELVSLNHHMAIFQWFGGLIGFANTGFMVFAFDFRHGINPPVVSFGLSTSEWEDVQIEAPTFTDWLERTLPVARK